MFARKIITVVNLDLRVDGKLCGYVPATLKILKDIHKPNLTLLKQCFEIVHALPLR